MAIDCESATTGSFFEWDGAIRIITIEEVKKRDEQTY